MLISSSSCNLARSTGISFRVLGVHAGGAGPNNLTRICTFLAFSPPFSTNFFLTKIPKTAQKRPVSPVLNQNSAERAPNGPKPGALERPHSGAPSRNIPNLLRAALRRGLNSPSAIHRHEPTVEGAPPPPVRRSR